jgi:hypothetical protein
MIRRYVFLGDGSFGATRRCLHCTWPLTQLFQRNAPMHRRFIRCWRPRCQNVSVSFHVTVGWTAADLSVHPVLKTSYWRVSVLFKHDHRIDQRFPPMDRQFIRRCCLLGSSSPIHPTQLGKGPSVHPTYQANSSHCAVYQFLRRYAPMVLSVHPTVTFSFVFFATSTWIFAST